MNYLCLFLEHIDDARMAMSLIDRTVSAQEIIISVAFNVPHKHTYQKQ